MISIQIQTVLYNNNINSLINSLESIDNAVRNTKNININRVFVRYGDASESALLNVNEVNEINRSLSYISLSYQFFGFNSGTSRGHNILGKNCSTDFMLVMNPDVILSPIFFDEIIKPFSNTEVGIVEARQVPIEHPKEYNPETGETGWAAMACAIFPTSVFHLVNGFDAETFFLYCDDVDFSWRVRMKGLKIIYQPTAMVFHPKSLSVKCKWCTTQAERYYSAEAELLMAYKWSNNKRLKKLLKLWKRKSGEQQQAYQNFMKLKELGKLPPQVDPQGKVSMFLDGYYAPSRYFL